MFKKKITGLFFILLLLLSAGCDRSTKPKFAVAANLLLPMQEIQTAFEAQTGKSFDLISGSSGVLSAQIQHGAPFDLFFSANMKYPLALQSAGLVLGEPTIIVQGSSIFWSKYPFDGMSIEQLLRSGTIKSLAIANPDLAPYGSQAKNWLQVHGFWEEWQPQIVIGENIGQVNQYIRIGSVDAVFTAVSAKNAKQLQNRGYWKPLESTLESGIPHVLVKLVDGSEAAQDIVEFLQSETAQAIFSKYGYLRP